MQVATLFGGNVTSLAPTTTSTMNMSSSPPAAAESVLTSMEEEDEETTTKMSTKDTPSSTCKGDNLPSSSSSTSSSISSSNVSTLVNLASSALIGNEQNFKSQQVEENNQNVNENEKAEVDSNLEAVAAAIVTAVEVENKQEQVVPMDEDISRNERNSAIIPNIISENPDDSKVMVNLDNKTSQSPYDCSSASANASGSLSPTSFELKEPKSQTKVMSSSCCSSISTSSSSSSSSSPASLEINNFNACAASNQESSSSQATTLLFQETFSEHEQQEQQKQQQTLPESSQIQNDEIPSSINPSNNIRETNGCVTSNLSDMNDLEAENLVIHHNDNHSNNNNNSNHSNNNNNSNHSNNNNMTAKEVSSNSPQNQMERLLHQQPEDERRQMEDMEQQALSHTQQMEFEHQQILQQRQQQQQQQQQQMNQQQTEEEEQQQQQHQQQQQQRENVGNGDNKHNQYSHANQFHECHRNDLNVDELSQRNIRDQQMSQQNSMDTNNVDDYKLQHVPENLEMLNQIDHQQHQYQQQHHLSQNQHNMLQHQHAQQLYLHHQDQQHMMHHHHQQQQQQHHQQQQQQHQQHQQQHQQHHHSELMAYLHHQDQQSMQQPHHIRTYQHYQQQHRMHQLPQHPQPHSPHHQPKNTSMTCIDDLMIDELHEDPNNRYKLLSPTVKHESQDDGYETSAGDVLTPNSHTSSQHSMTPQHQIHSSNLIPPKCEDLPSTAAHPHPDPDPYNFIDDEMNSNMRMMSPSSSNGLSMVMRQQNYESPPEATRLLMEDNNQVSMSMVNQQQQMIDSRMQAAQAQHVDAADIDMSSANSGCLNNITIPKKRGRKKKEEIAPSVRTMVDGILKPIMPKERKKHDRFNGMPEEEVSKRTLPDHLADNLDIIIIGINPGLFAAYKGHHYAGPGNHFWKCLYLSGLTHEQMTAEEDYKLLKFGIGFTNMVERATKGSADLTRKEIKEGSRILLDKLKRFRPKIAVFNGKLIFEVFSGKKDFNFGRQQECVEGTDTYMWVMPSSSARCAQLPRAADKVPFYAALKKFRDYLNGLIPHIDDIECVFNDQKSKQCCESESVRGAGVGGTGNPPSPSLSAGGSTFLSPECLNNENQNLGYNNSNSSTPERISIPDVSANLNKNTALNIIHKRSPMDSMMGSGDNGIGGCGMVMPSNMNGPTNPTNHCNSVMHMSCIMDQSSQQQQQQPEKKKRGRPKKIKGIDGEEGPIPQKVRNTNSLLNNNNNNSNNNNNILNLTLMGENGEIPKKKRGRPKKIKSDIGVNLSHGGANITPTNNSNCNSNNGNLSAINNNNSMDNSNSSIHNAIVNKTDICLHRNSPSSLGNHQLLSINNSNHFNSQSMSQHQQQQSLQNQRLFTSPMHSPNTVSSYCPMGMSASTTPPIGNNPNSSNNPSNLVSNGPGQVYHHQQHANSHHLQAHQQHNHNLQQHVQHQLHIPSLIYMQSPNHNPQQSSKSPHYGSSHSDLSTEISAAISSDHLAESQSASSPAMVGAVDYDRPDSIPNDEHSAHDLRFTSPTPNSGDQQQQGGGVSVSAHQHSTQHYHNIYQNPGSNQSYLSGNTMGNSPGETTGGGTANTNNENENVNYIASTRPNTSNSNNSTPQPVQNPQQTQQRTMQISDVTSKSLSGLESLVDQIPTIAENDSANNSINSAVVGIKSDSNEDFPSPSSGGSGAGSSNSGGLGCVYIPSYSNLNSSSSSSPSAVAVAPPPLSNSSILHSPHHYPDPIYSTANTCPSSTNSNSNNNLNNYNSIASNFSVSSLTSNNYSSNSYHSNLMAAAAASSPHHITSSASGSPMYMDPHMAVSPIYHHPYAQHAGYGAYSPVGHPPPPPPTLHMPSPNYPYPYPNTSGYPNQTGHHPSHSTPAGYLTNHPSMFDRIKPDIGYGGY